MLTSSSVSKEVADFRGAEWEGYRRLARRLPDHHVLAVQLIRTHTNETAVIFTTVHHGEPVQSVLMGDSRGRPYPNQQRPETVAPPLPRVDALSAAPAASAAPAGSITGGGGTGSGGNGLGDVSPDTVALGQPPVKQPITPGLISLGTTLLAASFDLGEVVQAGASK